MELVEHQTEAAAPRHVPERAHLTIGRVGAGQDPTELGEGGVGGDAGGVVVGEADHVEGVDEVGVLDRIEGREPGRFG